MRKSNKTDSIRIPLFKASPENRPNSVYKGVVSGPVANRAVKLGKLRDSAIPSPDILEQFSAILSIIQV